ncbi:MAG TPA: glycosyltransferase [Vicinamibacterales bacterium]|nr:glycosyltransferase [Vicinamibacterales bacterium]
MACRVLHVIPAVAPRYGGPSAATFGLCHALEAAGVEVVVATTDADGPGRLAVDTGSLQKYLGVPVIFFPRTFSESFKWSGPLSAWVHANAGAFDLVHIHSVFSHSSIAASRACRAARVPYFVRPLGHLDPWSLNRHRLRKQVLMRLGAGEMLRRAVAIHYTSDAERTLAESAVPSLAPGVVVPLGIDDQCFAAAGRTLAANDRYVLALSRLDVKKGLDLLIRAFHALAAGGECRGWSLVIAGDGDASYVAELARLAADGPARGHIRFAGWVSGEARRALVEGAGLFALPSHQENFGLAVAEAMAGGVPVIVSPAVNLANDILAEGAGWVAPRDQASWEQALRLVLNDPAELERRGRRARSAAERYRWPAVARQLVEVYDNVLRRRPEEQPRRSPAVPARQAARP